MATLTQRVLQLALRGYDFTDIAALLGLTPVEVDEVLKNQAHELTGGGEGSGVPRDEHGRPILPAIYAQLGINKCALNMGVEGYALILGDGSIGHSLTPPLELQTGPCKVTAGEFTRGVEIYGPEEFGPLVEAEYVVTNLDGSQTIMAVAEHVALPAGVGPGVVIPGELDLNVFHKDGTDLTITPHTEEEGQIILPGGGIESAAGGTFWIKVVIQLPESS